MTDSEYGNTENTNDDAEVSSDSQRTEEDVSRETIEEARRRALQYKADGALYEDELPEGLDVSTPEAEAWLKDKLSGWRGKRKEKGFDDPGYIRDAVIEGMREGFKEGKPKEPSVEDDPYQLMSPKQRKQYESLLNEGTDDERFQFLVDMGVENRKAYYKVYEENKALKEHVQKMAQVEGAAREIRMIHKIDPDFPDPDIEPEAAWEELQRDGGYFEWLRETGIQGSVNRTYKLYLADIGKGTVNRKKATEEAKKAKPPQPKAEPETAMRKIADTMGNVSGGGAVVGRDADDAEIRQYIATHGVVEAAKRYPQERVLTLFNKTRGVSNFKR